MYPDVGKCQSHKIGEKKITLQQKAYRIDGESSVDSGINSTGAGGQISSEAKLPETDPENRCLWVASTPKKGRQYKHVKAKGPPTSRRHRRMAWQEEQKTRTSD